MKQAFIISLLATVTLVSCGEVFGHRIRGNGIIKTETRTSGEFTSVNVSGAIDLYIKQDAVNSIKVEADENLLQYVEVHNDGGTLQIHEAEGVNLKPTHNIKIGRAHV